MKYLSLIFTTALAVLNSFVFAQTPADKIDSLEKVIAQAGEDTVKARSLCRLCDVLRKKGRYDEALKTGEEGLVLIRQQKDAKGEAMCLVGWKTKSRKCV